MQRGYLLLVLGALGLGGGRRVAAYLSDAEDRLPAVVQTVGALGGVAEAGRDEGALGPAVGDAGDVPVDHLGRRVPIQLVAYVDQLLYRCYVYVVH